MSSDDKQSIQVHYLKSNSFKTISGEGIVGSVTPHGKIYFVVYSERGAIPRSTTHSVSATGELGPATETETRGGLVREMEVGVLMERDDAERFRDWLTERISDFDEASKQLEKQQKKKRNKENGQTRRKNI